MRLILLCGISLIFHVTSVIGQNVDQLNRLDSLAFHALEHGDTSVTTKANALLAASLSKKNSFYGINAHTILGIVNKDKGYYLTSLEHYLTALNLSEKMGDLGRVSACYNNIGCVYLLQENYIKACEYFNKSLKIEQKLNQPLQKSIRYYNLGDAYSKMDSFDLALSFYNNSWLIEQKLNNSEGIAYAQIGIADVYIKIDRLVDAKQLLLKLSSRITKVNIEESILYHLLNGKIHLKRNEFEEALRELKKAEQISISNTFRIHLLDIYLLQIEIYKKTENWQKATSMYDLYVKLKDELNTTKVKNQLEDLTFQNELKKKELEIKLIQDEKELAIKNQRLESNTANHRTKIVWYLLSSFVLLFGLIFIGIRKLASKK